MRRITTDHFIFKRKIKASLLIWEPLLCKSSIDWKGKAQCDLDWSTALTLDHHCDRYPPRCRTPYKMKLMRSLKSWGWKVLLGARLMWWRIASEISLISGWLWLLWTNTHVINKINTQLSWHLHELNTIVTRDAGNKLVKRLNTDSLASRHQKY